MLRVSFDFDTESQTVIDLKVTTIPSKYENINLPIVEVGDNKLIISPKAISLLSVNYGDRIAVNYIQQTNEITFPVIGKSETFADPHSGNKLTKNNTVSFKGTQKTILTKYGQLFRIEEYKPNIFCMIPINDNDLIQASPDLTNENNYLNLV